MDEEWRPVPSKPWDEVFEISSKGNVRYSPRPIALGKHTKGYSQVELNFRGMSHRFLVHRLVAQAFLGDPLPGQEVNHKNHVTSDNNVENLEWCTRQDNILHSYKKPQRKRPPNQKINKEECFMLKNDGWSYKSLAKRYNVKVSTVWAMIERGKKTGHVV